MIQAIDKGTIRLLKADEVGEVLPLALAFHQESGIAGAQDIEENWEEVWSALIETETGGILGYEIDGKLVGAMCFLLGISPLDGILQMTEAMWYVLKPHRGEGMVLLEAAELLGRTLGCKRLFMAHLADTKADRLGKVFNRRGFTSTETYYVKEI